MRTSRFVLLISGALLAALFFAGAAALHGTVSTLASARQFFNNPFGLSRRVTLSGPVVLERVQRLQRLETSRYNGQVIVRGDTSGIFPSWLAGDRMLFVGRGEVVAGIDLARMRPDDVQVQGRTVVMRLPRTEVLYSRLDNQQSEVHERRAGILTGPDRHLESRVRLQAEEEIRRAAVDSGLLATAEAHARQAIQEHLRPLGLEEVRFL